MFTACNIRRRIFNIVGDKPFSIRDFLIYGSRGAVDQVFYRLVKAGIIIRIARGVFIREFAPMPSIVETATVKAAGFGKKIATHGIESARAFKLIPQPAHNANNHAFFAVNGCSSSFRFGNTTIHLINTTPRKMALGDSPVGVMIRTLWHLGKYACTYDAIQATIFSFRRQDRQLLKESSHLMPDWMQKRFPVLSGLSSKN